jgi:hypothetical protein
MLLGGEPFEARIRDATNEDLLLLGGHDARGKDPLQHGEPLLDRATDGRQISAHRSVELAVTISARTW